MESVLERVNVYGTWICYLWAGRGWMSEAEDICLDWLNHLGCAGCALYNGRTKRAGMMEEKDGEAFPVCL